jgi:hypothetical protein
MPWFRIRSHIKHGDKRTSWVDIYPNQEEALKAWKSNQHVSFQAEQIDAPTMREWWDILNRHDWYYEQSDDYKAVQEGRIADGVMYSVVQDLPETHKQLYQRFLAWVFWNEEGDRSPKPDRPLHD